MAAPERIRIGTRGSPLALAQAHETRDRLTAAHDLPADCVELVLIRTTGDAVLDRALGEIGGKGLFTKEIDEALLDGRIDLAVHSMKDVPTLLPDGISLGALLPREDVRDAFLAPRAVSLLDLPPGAVVGTASLRRQAQVLWRRKDLKVMTFRGNVQTRLAKLEEGQADATYLAMAGLRRLGLTEHARSVTPVDEMLPAVAQGAIGLAIRTDDADMAAAIAPLDDPATGVRVAAERSFLKTLDGSCRTPLAGLAVAEGDGLWFRGEILKPDGSERFATERRGAESDAAAMGCDAAEELLAAAGSDFLA